MSRPDLFVELARVAIKLHARYPEDAIVGWFYAVIWAGVDEELVTRYGWQDRHIHQVERFHAWWRWIQRPPVLSRYWLEVIAEVIGAHRDDGSRPKRQKPEDIDRRLARRARQKAQHDPSWQADQPRFAAAADARGLTYDQVCAVAEVLGLTTPSHWSQVERDQLLRALREGWVRVLDDQQALEVELGQIAPSPDDEDDEEDIRCAS